MEFEGGAELFTYIQAKSSFTESAIAFYAAEIILAL